MKQQQFEQLNQSLWQDFSDQLSQLEKAFSSRNSDLDVERFSQHYRRLCHHLALSKSRQYSKQLTDYLNALVLRGHQQLYQPRGNLLRQLRAFFVRDFSAVIHNNRNFIYLASALLYLPALLAGLFTALYPELVYSVVAVDEVNHIESMYDPANRYLGRDRDSQGDIEMFGFYIQNNIGVSFRAFASGIIFGVGSILVLFYNGLMLGALSAHLSQLGFGQPFFSFVIAHGAFELTAIAFSGAAGLKLGYALLVPGNIGRIQALKAASRDAIQIMYGVILMLIVAAFLEAFWSSKNSIGYNVKYFIGSLFWVLVAAYFHFGGKRAAG